MTRRRRTLSGKKADIFAPTRRPASGKRKPGRPPVHDEAWTKVTVVLFNRQIVFLDRLAANIRAQSGAAISRAQLIRSVVDALEQYEDIVASAEIAPRHYRQAQKQWVTEAKEAVRRLKGSA